jgi:hypothetical protein
MSKLGDLQQSIIHRLTAADPNIPSLVPVNGTIQWITEDIGDFANIIARAVGKLGIIGIVMTPHGKLIKLGEGPNIAFHSLVEVQIQENVTINRGASGTQIAALALADFCMKRLHWWSRDSQKIRRIQLDEIPFLLVAEVPLLVYNVRFTAPISIQ